MHSPGIKNKVKEMRKSGTSIGELSSIFGLNKSTVSYWCRDISLSNSAIKKIKTKGKEKSVRALLSYSEVKRTERIKRTGDDKKKGAFLVKDFSERDLMMVGFGLYWGEGYKESNGELGFTNSNPGMVKFYLAWLKSFNVSKLDLIFRLTINNFFRKNEKDIKQFWVKFLDIQEDQFSKTTVIKTKLQKGFVGDLSKYKGILRVKVRRGLSLKNKILGAIDHVSASV